MYLIKFKISCIFVFCDVKPYRLIEVQWASTESFLTQLALHCNYMEEVRIRISDKYVDV